MTDFYYETDRTVNYFQSKFFLTIVIIFSLTAYGNLSNEVKNKLNKLKNRTESLDSIINKEVYKVLTLDQSINIESEKVKRLDSLIYKNSSKLNSIPKKGSKLLEKITN